MKVGELFIKLGFNTENVKLNDFVQDLKNLDLQSVKSVAGLTALYYALKKIMEQSTEAAMALYQFNQQTGLSTKELQQWTRFAEKFGAQADDVAAAVKNIQQNQAQIRLGTGNIMPYNVMRINPFQSPFKILKDTAEAIKNLDPSMTRLMVHEMGISESMIPVLKNFDKYQDLLQKQKHLTDSQINQLFEFQMIWKGLGQDFTYYRQVLGATLEPAFRHLGMFINDVVEGLKKLDPFKNVLIVIFAGLAAYLFPITSAITLLVLLIDDFYTKMEGGKSIFDGFASSIKFWYDSIAEFFHKNLGWIDNLLEKFGVVSNIASQLGSFASAGFAGYVPQGGLTSSDNRKSFDNRKFVTIKVDGALNPMQIGAEISKRLHEMFAETQYQSQQDNQ